MNKRINQLYEQALEFAYENVSKEIWNTDNFHAIVAGKFAELIVQECVACATWVGKMNTTAVEPVHTAQAINQRIKKHFGVEQ